MQKSRYKKFTDKIKKYNNALKYLNLLNLNIN